ncbi:MAG: pyruvate dehydrogenase complex E1 component subunit beta [Acidobacteriota bacterium]
MSRKLTFSLAINEALRQAMMEDPSVVVIGQGVKSPWYVGNTCKGLLEEFGDRRVFDTPVSENAVTGLGVGAAMAALRPVVVHPRMDFMLYAMDPIINQAANWRYMSGGSARVPVVFWGIINRGGEQAAQHSQALHSLFAHVPGLKVVAPSTPCDAKGLMVAAIRDEDPVLFVDDRWLYGLEEDVPEATYEVTIGEAVVRRSGKDATIVAFSYLAPKALEAASCLQENGISCEVIDLRSLKPWDAPCVAASVERTGRALVCDVGWRTGGFGAEVAAHVAETCWVQLKAPVRRLALPDLPAPASRTLEAAYYPGSGDIVNAVEALIACPARES